jgi:two-component system LytT family response regulator
MKVIIVDDEERARVSLRYLISEFLPNVEIVAECDGIPNAVKSIHKFHPDLVFL